MKFRPLHDRVAGRSRRRHGGNEFLMRSIAHREQERARARLRAFFEIENSLKSKIRLYCSTRKQPKADDRSAQCARTGSDEGSSFLRQ